MATQTMNSVTTLMTAHNTEGTVIVWAMATQTMNSVTTLMTSHNTEGTVIVAPSLEAVFFLR